MMSLWEILKASKTGIAPDIYTRLLSDKLVSAGNIAELADVPPLYYRSNGKPLIDYTIYGNTVQNGTPTPENPIQPQECGELETTGTHAGQYKIPIASAGQTANIYLGEVETTRRVKKLVLTGNENWYFRSGDPANVFFIEFFSTNFINNQSICTHYINQDIGSFAELEDTHVLIRRSTDNIRTFIGIRDSSFISGFDGRERLKQWLAQQYAAGTPVTIWYVLEEPKTGVVNEPLMKIGDYADTLSMAQAGVEIPTIRGNNVFDVNTAVKPSEVRIKYHKS